MALVFPRAMPARGARSSYFELQRIDYASPEVGGAGGAVTAGPARWSGRWSVTDASGRIGIEWRAWASSLRGVQRTFIGRDVDRPFPAYWRGGLPDAWNGQLTSWSQSFTSDGQAILSVTGLYGGMGIAAGDYVDFRWTGSDGTERRTLVRSVEDVAAPGGEASFAVEPPVPAVTPANATPSMNRPGCLMRLDPANTTIAETDMTRAQQGSSVIAGLQVIYA